MDCAVRDERGSGGRLFPGLSRAAFAWVAGARQVFAEEAGAASKLLMDAGLHGRRYAIDAEVAEAALRQHRPVVMVTSDIDDMVKLCGHRVRLVAV